MAKRKEPGVPGEYHRGPSTVETPAQAGGPFKGTDTFVLTLRRVDQRYGLTVKWITFDSHTGATSSGALHLPHEVLARLNAMTDSIVAQAKRDRARAGYQTRLAKAQAEAEKQGKPAPDVLRPFEQKGA